MANSSSSNSGVPPGFRFHPTDEELLHYYLKKKISFEKFDMEVVREIDLNKMEPWDLQEKCKIGSTPQNEWYLFSHKDKKYPTGSRTNRATNAGFWKATGRDKCIRNTYKKIGMRKTLVFYKGRAPHGHKTDWIMHEYRLEDSDDLEGNSNEDGWVICRVFKKKNLFKIGGNGGVGGGSSMNSSSDHQQLNNRAVTFMHMRDNQYYLHQPQTTTFELNKQPELGLHYSHLPTPQYSLFQSQSLLPLAYTGLNPSEDSNAMVKQLMTNPRECDESGSESLRYQTAANCEPGLEVGTGREHEGMNDQWTMAVDRIVTNTHHLGNQDSKGVRFDHNQQVNNANATSINQVNQLSLSGEMDFWGYEK